MFENIKSRRSPLGTELINKGLITEKQLDEVLNYQKDHPEFKIGEVVDIFISCSRTAKTKERRFITRNFNRVYRIFT